jgi:hypothetical protein
VDERLWCLFNSFDGEVATGQIGFTDFNKVLYGLGHRFIDNDTLKELVADKNNKWLNFNEFRQALFPTEL